MPNFVDSCPAILAQAVSQKLEARASVPQRDFGTCVLRLRYSANFKDGDESHGLTIRASLTVRFIFLEDDLDASVFMPVLFRRS